MPGKERHQLRVCQLRLRPRERGEQLRVRVGLGRGRGLRLLRRGLVGVGLVGRRLRLGL